MNKVRVFFLGLSFVFLLTSMSLAQQAGKIAYVNLSRLFDEYSKTKEYDKVLESKHADFEKQRNTKIEQIREAQGKLALLKEDKKAELDQGIEKMKADLLEYDRQQKQDLTKDRNEKIREILLEIEKIVSTYAKEQNYDYILNDRVLIYGNPAQDKTEDVLKILNTAK
ncbi:MAG: OmpH family outer membrane protein [Candidatus Omnitrophota bacterium]|nr:OmpH family outer membrane protein [Candidatus Omnitrophota bacterium]